MNLGLSEVEGQAMDLHNLLDKNVLLLQMESRDLLIINVSPLEFGASLLVPAIDSCLPQVGAIWQFSMLFHLEKYYACII